MPHEVEEILDLLPPQVILNVPAHVLGGWFPASIPRGGMNLAQAQNFAESCGCKFAYHESIREGIFYRLSASEV